MTVFKAYLKILNKNKITVILYTVLLISFNMFTMSSSNKNVGFTASKPNIIIINDDTNDEITGALIKYMSDNCNIKDLGKGADAADDAVFYRDADYVIHIPEGFNAGFSQENIKSIDVKSTGEYDAALAQMFLSRFINTARNYADTNTSPDVIGDATLHTLSKEAEIEIISEIDEESRQKATSYYNFSSYSIMACLVYVICLVLSGFKDSGIQKRTVVSGMNHRIHNRYLLFANVIFAAVLWAAYTAISFIFAKDTLATPVGALYIINSLIFTFCAVTIAFFIGNLVTNKNAINAIINVVALGSSFLCGVFVPVELLPKGVSAVAHILPPYYFVSNNEVFKSMEHITGETMLPVIISWLIMGAFCAGFLTAANIISGLKRKRKNTDISF